jgi:microcystin-dependent protein
MSVQNAVGYEGFPVPVGTIVPFFLKANQIPPAWALCDGRVMDADIYPELFSVIGTNYSLSTDPTPVFRLPSLTDPKTYIQPFLTRSQGLLPPEIATNTTAVIDAVNLPPLDSSKFTTTNPTIANFAKQPATLPLNVPIGQVLDSGTGGQLPSLMPVRDDNKREPTCTAVMATATAFRQGEDEPLKINIEEVYPVQYGGIGCLYIMKIIGLSQPLTSALFLKNIIEQQVEQQAALVATAAAVVDETEALFSPVAPFGSLVVQADAAETALATYGQGGGTTPLYLNDPNLSGFVIPGRPTF